MKRVTILLYEKQEYKIKDNGFIPSIHAYLHEDGDSEEACGNRPAMLIAPGGGYGFVSSNEGYLVAKPYYDAGYQVYVLTYTVNSFGALRSVGLQPLKDISRAVCEIRSRAKIDQVNSNQIAAVGFSAGGHLVASLVVHSDLEGIKLQRDEGISNKLNAAILSYPVITSGEYTHEGSMKALFGEHPTEKELHFASLEKHITSQCPPVFLWHTMNDTCVPVENSLLFMKGCQEHKVPVEMHLFANGKHGLSVATEEWVRNEVGDSFYTYEQTLCDMEEVIATNKDLIFEEFYEAYQQVGGSNLEALIRTYYQMKRAKQIANPSEEDIFDDNIKNWVEMSIEFLKNHFV